MCDGVESAWRRCFPEIPLDTGLAEAANPEVIMFKEIEAKLASAVSSEFRSPFAKADSLLAVVFEVLKDGVDQDDLCDAVDHVWATVVVPYNVPYLPEFIEQRLERRALRGIHEAIHSFVDNDSINDA